MPTNAQVDKALELIQKGGGNYQYFFEKLSSPLWIGPLAKRGRFDYPPGIERIGNMYRFPPWPEGEYLLRMADVAPEEVAAAIKPICLRAITISFIGCWSRLPASCRRRWRETLRGKKARGYGAAVIDSAVSGKGGGAGGTPGNGGRAGSCARTRTPKAILEVRAPKDTQKSAAIEAEDGSTIDWKPALDPEAKLEPVWHKYF